MLNFQELPPNITAIIVGCIGIFGALVGFLSSLIVTYLSNKSEERKQINEIVIKLAIEDRKMRYEAMKNNNLTGILMPIQDYVIIMIKFADLIKKKHITEKKITKTLEELKKISDLIADHRTDEIFGDKQK